MKEFIRTTDLVDIVAGCKVACKNILKNYNIDLDILSIKFDISHFIEVVFEDKNGKLYEVPILDCSDCPEDISESIENSLVKYQI